ncbi:unnamed protein product [Prorocentrum cordatum]|uniref:Uncharacterized protein n=1 Tax=Prorocentrum cordatum TaxID=2364126 RepID=A0ABN9Q3M1_9DINO|nr:unnamed protein product [Polarella glacialis]
MRNTTALAAADELDASSESQQLTDKNSGLLPLRQRRTSTHHLQPGGTLGPLGMPRRSARGSVSTRLPLTTHNTVHGDVEKKTEEAGYLVTEQGSKRGSACTAMQVDRRRSTKLHHFMPPTHDKPKPQESWDTSLAYVLKARGHALAMKQGTIASLAARLGVASHQ